MRLSVKESRTNGLKGRAMSNDERLTELEIRYQEQVALTDDLSAIIAKQQEAIDRLGRRLDVLVTRFVVVEEQVQPDIPVDRPPHY